VSHELNEPLDPIDHDIPNWCFVRPTTPEGICDRETPAGNDDHGLPEQRRRPAQYVLTDQTTGNKTPITGTSDLEQHAANHTVKVTGTNTIENGRAIFSATKVEHIAATCTTPSDKK
jgi:hypothetical protein